jgi:hypothetical protein
VKLRTWNQFLQLFFFFFVLGWFFNYSKIKIKNSFQTPHHIVGIIYIEELNKRSHKLGKTKTQVSQVKSSGKPIKKFIYIKKKKKKTILLQVAVKPYSIWLANLLEDFVYIYWLPSLS